MLKNYLKISWKVLWRNKFFTFVSLFGISITLAILLVVTAVYDHLMYPKNPEVNRDRSLYLHRVSVETEDGSMGQHHRGSLYFMDRYVKKLKTPEAIAIASRSFSTITFREDRQLSLQQMYTCEVFWEVHEFDFIEGGPYTLRDITDNRYVTVISEDTRDEYFGKGKTALGQWISVDKVRYLVVGVVGNIPSYHYVTASDLYMPYNTSGEDPTELGFIGEYTAVLLIPAGMDPALIKPEFNDMLKDIRLPEQYPFQILEAGLEPYLGVLARELLNGETSDILLLQYVIFGGMFLFMLLPALNLANLNKSRIMERASEIGVRKAFGATSSALTIQFMIENLVLSVLGGVIGLVLGGCLLRMISTSGWVPHADLRINFNVLLSGVGLTVLFAILSGLIPARRLSKLGIVQAINDRV